MVSTTNIDRDGEIVLASAFVQDLPIYMASPLLAWARCMITLPMVPVDQARRDGVPEAWLEAARKSPVWKMAMEWKVAFPLHPEYRTLPMVWYVPPLSPIQSAAAAGKIGHDGAMPDVRSLRIPLKYLANLLTAGKEQPVALGLERMLAMRAYMRAKTIDGVIDEAVARRVGLTSLAIGGMISWAYTWHRPGGRLDLDAMGERMAELTLQMVGAKALATA